MSRRLRASIGAACSSLTILLALAAPSSVFAAVDCGGSGGGSGISMAPGPTPKQPPRLTHEQRAREAFRDGEKQLVEAAEYLAEIEALDLADADSEKKRRKLERKKAKLEKKASKRFERAVSNYERAIENKADYFQAYSQLGVALRNLGRHEEALTAYDRALGINRNYPETIAYRGEAYLELRRFEDAKGAYMQLFKRRRQYANQLLDRMKLWLEQHRDGSGGVTREEFEDFEQWVMERDAIVRQTWPSETMNAVAQSDDKN